MVLFFFVSCFCVQKIKLQKRTRIEMCDNNVAINAVRLQNVLLIMSTFLFHNFWIIEWNLNKNCLIFIVIHLPKIYLIKQHYIVHCTSRGCRIANQKTKEKISIYLCLKTCKNQRKCRSQNIVLNWKIDGNLTIYSRYVFASIQFRILISFASLLAETFERWTYIIIYEDDFRASLLLIWFNLINFIAFIIMLIVKFNKSHLT